MERRASPAIHKEAMNATASTPNVGAVVSVRGSVVDVRFDGHLPAIYSVLHAGEQGRIVIEVLAQRDARHVRGIALTPTEGLARGMPVEDTGGPLKAPVGKGVLSRMFDVFGHVIREALDESNPTCNKRFAKGGIPRATRFPRAGGQKGPPGRVADVLALCRHSL
jgi:F0F1-type ATP synthase beta subunit